MTDYQDITYVANMAYGIGAAIIAPPFSAYRIQPESSGNYVQPQNLLSKCVPVDRRPMKSSDDSFEGPSDLKNFWYELMGNFNCYLVGDVFILNRAPLNKGWVSTTYPSTEFTGFCLAENYPTRHAIGARLNTTAQLYTSSTKPDPNGHFDSTYGNRMPIILQNGKFASLNAGQIAAEIPVGVMPHRSYGGAIYNQSTANMPPLEKRLVYMPPLNGYQPVASDELLFTDGSRYIIESNYHQTTGTSGGIYICRKHVTGGGQ